MSHQLSKCSRCGKTPLNGFVGTLCVACWRAESPRTRQEKLV